MATFLENLLIQPENIRDLSQLINIDTLRDERLTDYIRENKDFIAVTQVKVSDKSEKDLFRTHFLNVSTRHIEIILPAE